MTDIQKIASRDHSKLTFVSKVRDGKVAEKIFIEGIRLAEEALRSKLSIENCFISTGFGGANRSRELLDELIRRKLPVFQVAAKMFQSLADTKNSQGIILIADKPSGAIPSIEDNLRVDSSGFFLVIFLYEINDPSNLGAVFRTAEAAGVAGIILSNGSADAFSPKAVRSAMGANFRIPVWEKADLDDVLEWTTELDLRSVAADINGANVYTSIDWKIPSLLVFGSEAHGLSREVREKIDEIIYIPMKNTVESLNLSVSCGVILFEAVRQNLSVGNSCHGID